MAVLYRASVFVDVHDADIAAEWIGKILRIVIIHRFEPRFHSRRMICVGSKRDLLNSLRAIRGALDEKLVRFPVEVVLVSLEQVGGDLPRFVFDLSTGNRTGGAGNRSAPAGIRSQSV